MCDENQALIPDSSVTPELFRHWQFARRANNAAEDLSNPVWAWMFRDRVDPYFANQHFKAGPDFPGHPRWAGCRLGQSHTTLSDGREFWIAGEHEDHYDPDFFIYNDVIVQYPDQRLEVFGYPANVFRPTDFHSATVIRDESEILIIGSVGYPDDRCEGTTPVYSLNLSTLNIQPWLTTGDCPGWISDQHASLTSDEDKIVVTGGKVLHSGCFIENIDDWRLDLASRQWSRLTQRNWTRIQVFRNDRGALHLWEYSMHDFDSSYMPDQTDAADTLRDALGMEPDLAVYRDRYRFSHEFETIKQKAGEDDFDWRNHRIVIDGVTIRFTEDSYELMVTVEGELPRDTIQAIADELCVTISKLENHPCGLDWIGG